MLLHSWYLLLNKNISFLPEPTYLLQPGFFSERHHLVIRVILSTLF